MTTLFCDIGNTNLKWAVLESDHRVGKPAFLDSGIVPLADSAAWAKTALSRHARCIICDVSKQHIGENLAQQAESANVTPLFVHSAPNFGILRNAYHDPRALGADRWCALIAAAYHHLPVCIVSCGSAVTVDVIDAHGKHIGGIISTGLQLMRKALADSTTLPAVKDTMRIVPTLQQATAEAVEMGTFTSLVAFCRYWLSQYAPSMPCLLTGGDAPLVLPYTQDLKQIMHYPQLTLTGMAYWYRAVEHDIVSLK